VATLFKENWICVCVHVSTVGMIMSVVQVSALVMCHTRELAFQISKEYERFSKYMNNVKIAVFFGGMLIEKDQQTLRNNCPHIVVGTPGRILALVRARHLNLKNLKHFVLDECDKMLDQLGEEMPSCHYVDMLSIYWSRYVTDQ